ncbi:MAG: DUF268 domain-containing protein [Chitinophagaceae bacterium]|nr:MAG: DUF268 domain-containing protein [Chitinophagaceae bacterium]
MRKFLRFGYNFVTKALVHPRFIAEFYRFRKMQPAGQKLSWLDIWPITNENTASTKFDSHYIYHPAWAARIVKKVNPAFHVDISSTLHFCTQLSAFIPTRFYDYRPAFLNLPDLQSEHADLCALSFGSGSVSSLSCMHTIEHVGLGRYGDPIDPSGDRKAASELKRVLAPSGSLLMVMPVGRPRIMFNGQRIYSYEQVMQLFDGLTLEDFSLIPDNAASKGMIMQADASLVALQNNGCGCFWFKKPAN